MGQPAGRFTFLFTDVEASTAHARALGDRFAGVLETHRRLIRDAVAAHGGREVDAKGDEVFAAFDDAAEAVAAAVDAQRALAAEEWPEGTELRVRMGLHSGNAEVDEGTYVGLDVHRAARVSEVAVGGQILVSATARALVDDGAFEFADLGEHRLQGFAERERLFSVLYDEIPRELRPSEP